MTSMKTEFLIVNNKKMQQHRDLEAQYTFQCAVLKY